MEQLGNLATTTLAAPYTAGSGSISVSSATGFPTAGTFSVTILNAAGTVLLIFRVTSVSGTTFTGSAEGSDASAASGSIVQGTMLTTAALTQIRADAIQFGTRANLPSTTGQLKGNLYRCTDSPYEYIFDGSVWQPYVFGFNVVEPVLANFTQVNVDKTTFVTTYGGIIFQVPNNSSTEDFQYIALAVPGSGQYFVDAAFIPGLIGPVNAVGVGGAGAGLSKSTVSTDPLVTSSVGNDSGYGSEYINKLYTTGPKNTVTNRNNLGFMQRGPLVWTRYQDDRTTNRTAFISVDGQDWVQVHQESRTTTFTPAFGTFGVTPFNATMRVHLVHFSIHT